MGALELQAAREPYPRQASASWKRPAKRRVRAIRDRLRELYGRPVNHPHGDPSPSWSDGALPEHLATPTATSPTSACGRAFATWEEVRDAPVDEVIEAIRPGGLANTKAPRIQAILRELRRPARSRLAAATPRATRRSTF